MGAAIIMSLTHSHAKIQQRVYGMDGLTALAKESAAPIGAAAGRL